MIIRKDGRSQFLITQPDHAALAGRIMRQWRRERMPDGERGAAVLTAIEQHDNGWTELDSAPIVDPGSGRVLDFITISDDVKRSVWPTGTERLASTPYAAALVSQHALH